MSELSITLGNKNYSSWSLRGWLALKQTGAPFSETVIPLSRSDSRAEILKHSPSGRVPMLRHGDRRIWDSLAIAEYLAETFPAAGLWPADPAARAVARSVAAEMHAGFAALRGNMPMDLRTPHPGVGQTPEVAQDIARITEIWQDCRRRFGRGGDFLFGAFTIADAFHAPVATRFVTYGVTLEETAARYRDAIMAWPALEEWTEAAKAEPWTIDYPAFRAAAASRP